MSPHRDDLIQLHQYLINQPDEMLTILFKSFTFLDLEEIESVVARHNQNPDAKEGHLRLIGELVHQITDDPNAPTTIFKYRDYFTLDFNRLVT